MQPTTAPQGLTGMPALRAQAIRRVRELALVNEPTRGQQELSLALIQMYGLTPDELIEER